MQKIVWKSCEFEGVIVDKMHDMGGVKEISIRLAKDAVMKEHKAPGAIMVHVLRGEIDFCVNDEVLNLKELDMVALDSNVSHSITALKDSIIRLSLSKNDSVSRVFGVLKS